jgi:hypothetical protein
VALSVNGVAYQTTEMNVHLKQQQYLKELEAINLKLQEEKAHLEQSHDDISKENTNIRKTANTLWN